MNITQLLTKLKALIYSKSETDSLLGGKANSSHTHTKSQITDFPSLATVATSGSYSDLSNKPTIPSKVSQLSNDSGFITSSGSCNYANSSGNADTLDGSHAWQMQTLAAGGGVHGSNDWLMQCQHNVDGDGYFKLYCGDKSVGTKVDRANGAGYADSAGAVSTSVAAGNAKDLVYATMANNDQCRIRCGGADNDGSLEIATSDDGNEPIYVRQYNNGTFGSIVRTLTLLDGSGNTQFPGTVSAPTFSGNLSGNASTATYANSAGSSSIATRDSGGMWISGRDNAVVKQTRHSTDDGGSWNPAVSVKTKSGNWTIGTVGYDKLQFSYDTDEDYNTGNNRNTVVELNPESGTIITSANIGSQSVNYATSAGSAGSVAWDNVSGKPSAFTPYFANGTWYAVGDDAAIGDHNVGGGLGVKALNSTTTRIDLCYKDDASNYKSITYDGTTLYMNGNCDYATNSSYTYWLRTSSHADHLLHTEWDGGYFWTYVTAGDGGYRAVRVERSNSAGWADSAGGVAWDNVSGKPNRNLLETNGATSLGWSGIGGVANGSTLQLRTTDNTAPSICFHRSGYSHCVLLEQSSELLVQRQGESAYRINHDNYTTLNGYRIYVG